MQVTAALNMMVRMTSELETNIVAVERTEEYADERSEVSLGESMYMNVNVWHYTVQLLPEGCSYWVTS